jgi:opacity protein-like surface antigen
MNQSALPRAGLCLLAAICFAAPYASALIELDRGVLILNTSFGVSYDSNILGQVDNESDTLLSLSPNLQYRREGGRGTMVFAFGASFVHYLDHDDLNYENYNASGVITVPVSPDSPLSGSVSASIGRSTDVSEAVGTLVTRTSVRLGANGGYAFSERLTVNSGVSWGTTDNDNFGDQESMSLSLGIGLQEFLFRRLPLSLSYGYSTSESTNDPTIMRRLDTTTHSVNVGTSGQISPRVSGNVSFGFRSTDDDGTAAAGGSRAETGLTAATSLAWAVDELNKVSLNLSKSLEDTPDNQSTDATRLGLSYSRKLSEQLSANAGISHAWRNYRYLDRDDKQLTFTAGLSYLIRRNWSAGVHYSYSDNSSDTASRDFSRHVLGANITASF